MNKVFIIGQRKSLQTLALQVSEQGARNPGKESQGNGPLAEAIAAGLYGRSPSARSLVMSFFLC
jgi:hypothetical protein